LWRIRDKTSENIYNGQKIQINTQQTNKYKSINITDIKKDWFIYVSRVSLIYLLCCREKKHLLYCREKTPALMQRIKFTCFAAEKKTPPCVDAENKQIYLL
jgi:hypothetical protein